MSLARAVARVGMPAVRGGAFLLLLGTGCSSLSATTVGIGVIDADGGDFEFADDERHPCGYLPPDWAPDSEHLVAAHGCESEWSMALFDVESGDADWTRDGSVADGGPYPFALSPDGSRLAVLESVDPNLVLRVGVPGSTPGGSIAEFPPGGPSSEHVTWTADGRFLVLATTVTPGNLDVVAFDSTHSWDRSHFPTTAHEGVIVPARSGSAVAVASCEAGALCKVRTIDLATGEERVVAERVAFPMYYDWSPKSDALVITSPQLVQIVDATTGAVRATTDEYEWATQGVAWSVTDRIVLGVGDSLQEMSPEAEPLGILYRRSETELWWPTWSPDGQRLAFTVRQEYRD